MAASHFMESHLQNETIDMTTTLSPDGESTAANVDGLGWSVSRIENSSLARTIYGLIALIGMSGNALVCFVLLRVPSLRTRTSQFIIHLAVTDFITSFWVIPFHLFPFTPPIPRGFAGELMCRFYVSKYLMWVSIFASVYSLVSITLERYFAIVHPIKYKTTFSLKYSIVIMIGCWLVGAISNSFFFYVYDYEDGTCLFLPYPTLYLQKVIGVYIFSLIYFIPITLNLVCHARMVQTLKKQAKLLEGNRFQGNEGNRKKQKEAWQLKIVQDVQRMLLVVVITFMICWAPNQFIFLAFNLGANVDFTSWYYHFSVILAVCNSCVNPFIYVFRNREFRHGVAKAIGCDRAVRRFANRVRPVDPGVESGTAAGGTDNPTTGTMGSTRVAFDN
ncbi:gastrin/cholecystokinin type B receptor-like [Strongylocentrotus purpuratus]|uniref:G-protein coupled receptors family 1 profile domain-containing protein n=1 Tax=Strongylocentrotus purpuratus TaxID=7668 RepID=A0A7M7HFU8_STRPU|nr:gastrin/cholecystokinin type B receptor-like [Strongylocentrotus purpuratus]